MLKIFEAFSGYGSQSIALKQANIPHEVVGISEVDVDATISYAILKGVDIDKPLDVSIDDAREYLLQRNIGLDFKTNKSKIPTLNKRKLTQLYNATMICNNFGDISILDVERLPDLDFFTYSFPCQDISVAGHGLGLSKGSNTRSSLLWECSKIIEHKNPKYLLMENVKNLVSKKHIHNFNSWLDFLSDLGYKSYWQVLNSKDYGVPQNRERVFVVSILGEHDEYAFPKAQPLENCLRDILEQKVDDKYYASSEAIKRFVSFPKNRSTSTYRVVGTTAPNPFDAEGNIIFDKCTRNWVYDPEGNMSTLSATDYKQPKQILEPIPIRLGGIFDDDKGRHQAGSIYSVNGLSPTIDTGQGGWRQPCIFVNGVPFRIRKLTPIECFRLQGVRSADTKKLMDNNISNTQLYKLCGNAITINVLVGIYENLFK